MYLFLCDETTPSHAKPKNITTNYNNQLNRATFLPQSIKHKHTNAHTQHSMQSIRLSDNNNWVVILFPSGSFFWVIVVVFDFGLFARAPSMFSSNLSLLYWWCHTHTLRLYCYLVWPNQITSPCDVRLQKQLRFFLFVCSTVIVDLLVLAYWCNQLTLCFEHIA